MLQAELAKLRSNCMIPQGRRSNCQKPQADCHRIQRNAPRGQKLLRGRMQKNILENSDVVPQGHRVGARNSTGVCLFSKWSAMICKATPFFQGLLEGPPLCFSHLHTWQDVSDNRASLLCFFDIFFLNIQGVFHHCASTPNAFYLARFGC